jgi:uncharacterized repeat protein (TIGR03803 family)
MQKNHRSKRTGFAFRPRLRVAFAVLVLLATVFGGVLPGWAERESVLYSFTGSSDGAHPMTSLIADHAGNFYGTASYGGLFQGNECSQEGCGVVFRLSRNSGEWTETVIYTFTGGADGASPFAGLKLDAQGNLYGTTVGGGSFQGSDCEDFGCGVVFELSPNGGGGWTECVLHSFRGGTDGFAPFGPLTFDPQGNLYGTAPMGGSYGAGEIYKLSRANGGWKYLVVHAFTGGRDGGFPSAGVALDGAGNIFASTDNDGGQCAYGTGCGTVVELSPKSTGGYQTEVIYVFSGGDDGGTPGTLTLDRWGNLYGAAFHGGSLNTNCINESFGEGCGLVFEISPRRGGGWKGRILYTFQGGLDGALPASRVAIDVFGNLFGTTESGGDSACNYCGVVYALAPTRRGEWKEITLHVFTGGSDGSDPGGNGITLDGLGSLFGAAQGGGSECFLYDGCGVIYKLTLGGNGP